MTQYESDLLDCIRTLEKTIAGALFEIADKLDKLNSNIQNLSELSTQIMRF
jgi:hypothetical protein